MRKAIVIVAVSAFAIISAVIIAQQSAANASTQRPNIRTVTIDRGDIILAVNATGSVAAAQTVNLSFENPGLIKEILVEEGQKVEAGQVLAIQDDVAQELALRQAEATLKTAELSLDQLLRPPDEKDLAVAEANIKAAQGAYTGLISSVSPAAIRAAELEYQKAITAWNDAIEYRRGVGGMNPTDSAPYQLALAREGQASFVAEIIRLQLEMLRRGADGRAIAAARARIKAAQAELDRLRVGPMQAQLDQAQLAIEQAKLSRDEAQRQLDRTKVKAPFAGIVSQVLVKEGALAFNNVPAFILTDTSELHVEIRVDEIDIGQLAAGQHVLLTVDALPDQTLTGKVEHVSLVANTDSTVVTYDVRVALDPTAAPIRVGMTTSATITVRELRNVLRVPNLYVRLDRRTNEAFVNLVNPDGSLAEVQVVLGLKTEEFSEVISGLNEGDTVGINLDSNFSIFGN